MTLLVFRYSTGTTKYLSLAGFPLSLGGFFSLRNNRQMLDRSSMPLDLNADPDGLIIKHPPAREVLLVHK